ncbi:ABC transporter substrate-binding protein [Microbacterium sp. MMO-138]|uniref:ABC transporter substrate-binding protein n=1 Tax=Microbacterium sp. MMO-138 TaxID=3081274 RepID=UPI003019F87F
MRITARKTLWRAVAAFAVTATLGASLLACSASDGSSSSGGTGSETIRVLSGSGTAAPEFQAFDSIVKMYQKEVDPKFKVEYETIPKTDDLWNKLRTYAVSDQLPDIFSIANGPIADDLIKKHKILNMTQALGDMGKLTQMNSALKDFFTSPDGNLYMIPAYRAGEMFLYRKDIFAKYGLSVPKTWDEFVAVCQKLKDNGVTPYVMRGADSVMLLRFLAFPSWTTSGGKFITSVLGGKQKFSDGPLGADGAKLLNTLGTGGYFVPGYQNMTLSDVMEAFAGGQGAITYANTTFASKFEAQYESGTVGYFGVPLDGTQSKSTGSTFPVQGGKGWGINADAYKSNPVLKKFFDYYMKHVDQALYQAGLLSWLDTPIPADKLPKMLVDIGTDIKDQKTGWVSWDDKLKPAVLTTMGDQANKLAAGAISPSEFLSSIDTAMAQ